MKARKGISLIVLVITIIVIIILAGAVILSLSTNNPITSATSAKVSQDKVAVQSAVTMYISKLMATHQGAATITAGNLTSTSAVAVGTHTNTLLWTDIGISMPSSSTAANWSVDSTGLVNYAGTY